MKKKQPHNPPQAQDADVIESLGHEQSEALKEDTFVEGADPLAVLEVIDRLEVGPVQLEPQRLVMPYRVFRGGEVAETELIYRYEQRVFDPTSLVDQNLASVIGAQVALNYGLFCKEIVFFGPFDADDQRFLIDMMENTSREIYIVKIVGENPFLLEPVSSLAPSVRKHYTRAQLIFAETWRPSAEEAPPWQATNHKICVLSSGGKDSLLSYGLLHEIGLEVHPIFGNESGRHWFTALNSYRKFQQDIEHTGRVWMNSDRVFAFMLRQLSFVRPDFSRLRADIYPVRLWTVAVFLFGVLPEMKRRGIGHLVIGNEFDSTMRERWKGLTHYSGGYDQSRFFDHTMSRYFTRKGWQIRQYSVVRPLSELLIEKILYERYPHLLAEQVSCHATHKGKDDRVYPCGRCEKCRRIQAMLTALGADTGICGYTPEMTEAALRELPHRPLKQEDDAYDHLLYMLDQKGALELSEERKKALRPHKEIVQVRFDREHSQIQDIPQGLRAPLYRIFLEHAEGAVERHGRMWQPLAILSSPTLQLPFPHERSHDSHLITPSAPEPVFLANVPSPTKEKEMAKTPKPKTSKAEKKKESKAPVEPIETVEPSHSIEPVEVVGVAPASETSSYDEIPAVGVEFSDASVDRTEYGFIRENHDDASPFPLPPRPKRDYLLRELTWPEAEQRFRETDVALLPVGAIEQHGPHLPLDVDAFDADTLARAVAARCPAPRPLVLPLIPYGVSYHHNDFSGTLSVSNETMSRMVYEIGLSAARNGITKLVIINGHGGNGPSLDFAAQMINRDARIFVAVDSGETSDVDIYEMTETAHNDVHAGEIETSTTLAVRPHLVHMDKLAPAVPQFSSRYLNFTSTRGIPWYAYTKKISENGVMGDPTKATAEKGRKIWEVMIHHLAVFVQELQSMTLDEIHQRRY